jgi:hypothetical protein
MATTLVRCASLLGLIATSCAVPSLGRDDVCATASDILAECGRAAEVSPFGACQPAQRAMAEEVVEVYEANGCSALADAKSDSFACVTLPFLCVVHSADELAPFSTDGCSMFPDGTGVNPSRWQHCCVTHDYSYYRGGTSEEKDAADRALGDCVASACGAALGEAMYHGVGMGGTPALPTPWRWGYGWSYDPFDGFRELPADQLAAANREIEAYKAAPFAPAAFEQRMLELQAAIAMVLGLDGVMDDVEDASLVCL